MSISSDTTKFDAIIEESEIAFLRADVCIGSPQSFDLDEKRAICEGIDSVNAKAEQAMCEDFQSWPPQAQARMLDLLQKADPDHFDWWISILVGEMPNSPDDMGE